MVLRGACHAHFFDDAGFEPGFGQSLPLDPITQPAFGCGHDVQRQFRRFDESGAAAGRRHVFRWTPHIDIQAVEPEFADDVGGLVKQLRLFAIQLGHDGVLSVGVP